MLAVLTGMLVVVASAQASSIAYIGSDKNVWVTTPDGAVKRQVTTDGSGKTYSGPAQLDDGTIVVPASDRWFYILGPDGSTRRGPYLSPTNSWSTSPLAIDLQPTGGLIAYWHLYASASAMTPVPRVAFALSDAPTTSDCTVAPCHSGYLQPRWIPGDTKVAMINSAGSQIDVQPSTGWMTLGAGVEIQGFDISRAGYRTLITSKDTTNGDHELVLWDNKVPPPDATQGALVCGMDNFSNGESHPRWSPDGTKFTWSDASGVWVSPAPVSNGASPPVCVLQPTLIAASGSNPDWSAATVPSPPQPTQDSTAPGGSTSGGSTQGGTTAPSTSPTADGNAAPATLGKVAALRRQRLLTALRRGLRMRVACRRACRTSIIARVSGRDARRLRLSRSSKRAVIVGRGSRSLSRAGTATVKVRFTRKAKARLRRQRQVRLILRITAKPKSGASQSVTRKLKLRR